MCLCKYFSRLLFSASAILLRIEVLVVAFGVLPMLARHVAKVPRERDDEFTAAASVHLMSREVVAACEGFPASGVEQVATVDRERKHLVEEIFACAEINVVAGPTIALGDDLAGAISARGLYGNVVGKDDRGCHTSIPREVVVGRPCDGLAVDVVAEAIELVVVGIGRCGEIEYSEELIFKCEFQTGAETFCHVHVGGVHESVGRTAIVYSLYDVGCRPIVGTEQQRVVVPRLQIVERERVAVFRS